MAEELIRSLDTEFDPSAYRDEYRVRVLELVEAKAAGETVRVEEDHRPGADAELVEMLRHADEEPWAA